MEMILRYDTFDMMHRVTEIQVLIVYCIYSLQALWLIFFSREIIIEKKSPITVTHFYM